MLNPRISLVIGVLSISIFPVLVKWAPVSGISSAFYRMFIGFICLLPFVLVKQNLQIPSRSQWLRILTCGILFGTDIAVWNLSIHYSNATQATLLTNLSPVWVGIGSFLFLTEKPKLQFWIGTIIAMAGLVVLIGPDTFLNMQFDKGFMLAVLSGMLYATYMLISKTVLNQISIVSFMTYSMGVSSLYLLTICLFTNQPLWNFTPAIWSIFAVQGVISQLLGWLAISYAVKKLDAERVSLSLLSQSVVTGLIAWVFIDEVITIQMIIGGIVILSGIGITFKKPKSTLHA
ncbi:DMT family transporter [Dyadobacter psychrotolerans]|uniref:DMT family transporter n=1 Tax=Dyadobacter psychrotolerans TaxID=2541721 RepID=A0A4R5E222_9BACT|nr:DMT family transporter [Dyadobacter psychrotolerans]TDE18265.1 DMT family transporter [Dyadobacter psychrotolerans]